MEPEDLGKAIHDLRVEKKIGLRELARMAEMSPASIVSIENGKSSPNLATLSKILKTLGTTFADFFANSEKPQLPVFKSCDMRSVCDEHREYTFLLPKRVGILFEMVYETIVPREEIGNWEIHDCDLGGFVISGGPALLEIEGQGEWSIGKGDSFYIKTNQKHRLINKGKSRLKQVTVMYPPRY